jgi:transcriptional regulator with XRE-family HTH domain
MSHSRVADLIGRSPATIKAWERGRSVPAEANVVSSLAAVLGIDEALLFQAAGMDRPGMPPRRSLGESLAEIAPSHSSTAAGASTGSTKGDADGAELRAPVSSVDVQESEPPPAREGSALQSRRELRANAVGAPVPPPEPGRGSAAILNAFDRIASRFRRKPRRHALVATPVTPTVPTSQPSYVEDPEQRLLYRFRSVLLVVGVLVLAVVFVWSAGEFLDAVGSSLDALFGSE